MPAKLASPILAPATPAAWRTWLAANHARSSGVFLRIPKVGVAKASADALTYATALGDLQGIEFVWIHRPRAIELALSRALYGGSPTMSVMLEAGAS